jgi:hypothetical protein
VPAPSSYTEETLAQYMLDTLKNVAVDLDWLDTTPGTGSYVEPVNDVEVALGVSDVAESSAPVALVRLQADVAAWRSALEAYTTAYYVGGLSRTLHREQLWDHCRAMLAMAEGALTAYLAEEVAVDSGVVGATAGSGYVPITFVW